MKLSLFLQRALCVLLVLVSTSAQAQNIDIDLLRDINIGRNKGMDKTWKFVTNTTYPIMITEPVAELVIGYARKDREMIRTGWYTAGGLVFTGIVTYGLKYGINRKPPYEQYPEIEHYETTISPSFPSGHATFAFYSAGSASFYYKKWYIVVPSYAWATAVCYSRMHLGDHYPSDVVVGAALGTLTSFLTYKTNQWIRKWKPKD